ncbi:hypothetical protein LJC27_01960 [Christensenellaceae bacterium OttesenSCG-928-M15]|nr:hypothetical protein [Christensenellaceae bacterium OttesenSCG-928-M15]
MGTVAGLRRYLDCFDDEREICIIVGNGKGMLYDVTGIKFVRPEDVDNPTFVLKIDDLEDTDNGKTETI